MTIPGIERSRGSLQARDAVDGYRHVEEIGVHAAFARQHGGVVAASGGQLVEEGVLSSVAPLVGQVDRRAPATQAIEGRNQRVECVGVHQCHDL